MPVPTTAEQLFAALTAAVPDLAALRDEHLADFGNLVPHVLLGEVVGWCEDHVADRRANVETIASVVADALDHGDEPTRNVALVSFGEGIFPGTPLWEAVPKSLRDTWSGPPA